MGAWWRGPRATASGKAPPAAPCSTPRSPLPLMATESPIDSLDTDILILGAGGAGLCAALHAADHSPDLTITVAVKGLLGRAGCTRMVQGGYNAVLGHPDSIEAHLLDTLHG